MQDLIGYQSAKEGAAFFRLPKPGFLRIKGNDRVEFIQRQTTNDVTMLTSGSVLMTVLTSPKARIQDVFWLLGESDSIGIITLPERANNTYNFLRSRIFFNDNVVLVDHSNEYTQIMLLGPQVDDGLSALGFAPMDLLEVSHGAMDGETLSVFREPGYYEQAYRLFVPDSTTEGVIEKLLAAGVNPLSDEAFEVLRVEAGYPGRANELTDDYTPLEVGLLDLAVSKSKGCYTGQEVIARQVNFDKITRKLVGLRLDEAVHVGDPVRGEHKPAGLVTSVAHSPSFGNIALAVLKRPFDQAGSKVSVGDRQASVVELPFE
jgi:folate-binding protein YgfZ